MAKGMKYIVRVQRYETHTWNDFWGNQLSEVETKTYTTHKVYKTLRGARNYIEKLYSSGEDVNVELYEQIPTKIEQQELYLKQPF